MVDLEHPICPRCSGPLHRIGEDVAEPLDIEPAQFLVPIVRRPRYASPKRLRRHPLVERCRRRGDMARPVVAACHGLPRHGRYHPSQICPSLTFQKDSKMTAEVEAVAGRGMDRQVPLRQGGGFEPLQLALASANRDMLRAFGPVAVPLGLDVRDATEPH